MRRSAVRTSSRSRVTSRRATRRTTRFALRCDCLERRQLLSVGQAAAAASVLASHSVPADVVATPATPAVAASGDSSIAAQSDRLGSRNDAQVGFLLSALDLQAPDAGAAGTSLAALGAIPGANGQGVNLALADELVSVLNPIDTSVAAALVDTQVDADAFLVPSTTEQLAGFLGVPTTSGSLASFMFSDLLGGGTAPDVTRTTTTNRPVNSNPSPPVSAVAPTAGVAGSHLGQALLREFRTYSQSATPDDGTIGAGGPIEPPQVQPSPQGDNAPVTTRPTQPSEPEGQAPAPATAPQPAGPEGQAPAPQAKPEPAQPGGPAGAPALGQVSALSPTRASEIDAALDLIDVRVLTRSRAGDAAQLHFPAARGDTSRSFSVLFGVAMVASGGQQLAMRAAARSRSYGRAAPRSLGAERPTRPNSATPLW
jgi:hypothetical protein